MTTKIKVADDACGLSVEGTEYKAKDGVVEVADHHATILTTQHGFKTVAQHQAAVEAEAKAKRELAALERQAEAEARNARIAEARATLEAAGIPVGGKK